MTALDMLRGWARNNACANQRLLAACAQLSPAELHASRTSFFPTIMKTWNHILTVDWYYIDAVAGEGRGLSVYAVDEPFAEIAPLADAQRASDRKLVALVDAMRDADVDAEVRLERQAGPRIDKASGVLLHLFQHQIHHRGQIHAMLSGTAVAPPQLDEFFLVEDRRFRDPELAALGLSDSR